MMQVAMSKIHREKYKHSVSINAGLWDSYKDFHAKYKLIYPDVDRKKYVDICHIINTSLSDKMIKESLEFRMPARLGVLSVKKSKVKIKVKDGKLEKNKMIIDWGKTWEYWGQEYPGLSRKEVNATEGKVVIYNMNEHTNGYVMRWKWDKTTAMVTNQTVYKFKPTKRNRLELGAWIKSDERENDYFLINKLNSTRIRKMSESHPEEENKQE